MFIPTILTNTILDNSEVYLSSERKDLLLSSMVYQSQLKVGNLRMCLGKLCGVLKGAITEPTGRMRSSSLH